MFVSRENERLYLTSWEYNAARVLARLEKVVSDNGGSVIVRGYNRYALVSDRTLNACIDDLKSKRDAVKTALDAGLNDGHDAGRRAALQEYSSRLEKYLSFDNTPIRCRWFTYISFILDGVYYAINLDNNFLFPFTYQKIRLAADNSYTGDYYAETLTKEWQFDSMIRCGCAQDDINEAAAMLFNSLLSGKFSKKHVEKERRLVANVYDGGYHYETIIKPGRVHRPLVSVID